MKFKILLFLFFIPLSLAQNLSHTYYEKLVNLLILNSQELSNYIDTSEKQISDRFGIKYKNVPNKFLIANEIPLWLSNDLISGKIKYEYEVENLDNNYDILTINIPALSIKREYYLKDSLLVSSFCYKTKDWQKVESDHFKFFISDPRLFNNYSIKLLEGFINKMSDVLDFTEADKNLLKEQKLYYFLCRDEDEIKKVTGFSTLGIFILANDCIITTYNTHFHEILHFLINFKLRNLPLYTHPFLQEGFAVAFGGRGGRSFNTIMETGVFLVKSGFENYKELLSKDEFQATDASISYPVSGLYVNFLISHKGIKDFIELYKNYSRLEIENINQSDLLSENLWQQYFDSLSALNPISINKIDSYSSYSLLAEQKNFQAYEKDEEYLFRLKDTLLISVSENQEDFISKTFREYFPNKKYDSEKYLIIVNENEISIYNLFSNTLIGKYAAGFSVNPQAVPFADGFYEFAVRKSLFDEELKKEFFVKPYGDQ